MDLASLIDRISDTSPVTRSEKESVLRDLEQVVDSYREGALLQPDVVIQERVGEMVSWLMESLESLSEKLISNSDTLEAWEGLETALYHLAAEVEEATRAFWTACGPTESVTANQLHHLCLLPADPEVTRERLRFLGALRHGVKSLLGYGLVTPQQAETFRQDLMALEAAVTQERFNLTPYLKPIFGALAYVATFVPLHMLDQDLSDGADWLSRFSALTQAFLEERLTRRDLLVERDLFLRSLEKLLAAAEELGEADALFGLTSHLRTLEGHFESEEDLSLWIEEARDRLEALKEGFHS